VAVQRRPCKAHEVKLSPVNGGRLRQVYGYALPRLGRLNRRQRHGKRLDVIVALSHWGLTGSQSVDELAERAGELMLYLRDGAECPCLKL